MSVTFANDFHGTTVTVRPALDGTLSPSQAKRVWRVLCGIQSCTCGDNGIRGPQSVAYEWLPSGLRVFVGRSR